MTSVSLKANYVTPGSSNKKKEKEDIIGNCYLDKVLKSGLSKFLKACLPQNLLSPLLNTLSHLNLIFLAIPCLLVRDSQRYLSVPQLKSNKAKNIIIIIYI